MCDTYHGPGRALYPLDKTRKGYHLGYHLKYHLKYHLQYHLCSVRVFSPFFTSVHKSVLSILAPDTPPSS